MTLDDFIELQKRLEFIRYHDHNGSLLMQLAAGEPMILSDRTKAWLRGSVAYVVKIYTKD